MSKAPCIHKKKVLATSSRRTRPEPPGFLGVPFLRPDLAGEWSGFRVLTFYYVDEVLVRHT